MSLRVAIVTKNDSFLEPVLNELIRRKCEVKRMVFSDHDAFNLILLHDLLNWANNVFFDFPFYPFSLASHWVTNCRISVRIHGLDVYDPTIKAANWSRVHLIGSAPAIQRFKREFNLKPASITEVGLGVLDDVTYKTKEWIGHHIGLVAVTALPRKRIYTTIESFCDLVMQSNASWNLHIRSGDLTGYRDFEAREYLKFIKEFESTIDKLGICAVESSSTSAYSSEKNQIIYHSAMSRDAYREYLRNLDIIVSNSMQEGYHLAIFEAMAYGVYPLVHKWFGADALFPDENLFLTQRELVDKILEWDRLRLEQKYKKSAAMQRFVRQRHNEQKCMKKVVDVILGEENE